MHASNVFASFVHAVLKTLLFHTVNYQIEEKIDVISNHNGMDLVLPAQSNFSNRAQNA